MIDTGSSLYMCDECPICEGVDHRLRLAEESGYTPQLAYCGCDKVQAEFGSDEVGDEYMLYALK